MTVLVAGIAGFVCALIFIGVPVAHWLERRSEAADRKAWRQMDGRW